MFPYKDSRVCRRCHVQHQSNKLAGSSQQDHSWMRAASYCRTKSTRQEIDHHLDLICMLDKRRAYWKQIVCICELFSISRCCTNKRVYSAGTNVIRILYREKLYLNNKSNLWWKSSEEERKNKKQELVQKKYSLTFRIVTSALDCAIESRRLQRIFYFLQRTLL